jgi:hypothetical protein
MFAPDEPIAALADGGVVYVLIGGPAVGAHGLPRATKGLDIVPAPDEENLRRIVAVLRAVEARHFETGDFNPAEFSHDPLKGQRKGSPALGTFPARRRIGHPAHAAARVTGGQHLNGTA